MALTLPTLTLALAAAASPELHATRVAKPPVIDGKVGEAEWQTAARASDFVEFEPHRGEASLVRTEALVMYDQERLYVAFRAFDPEPTTAQLTQRDADLLADDAVLVIMDADRNGQSASYFMTNPLGTQADGRISEDGLRVDASWDATWRSATHRHARGWSAEFAIPFSALHYAPGAGRTWGLNLARAHARTRELSYWAGPPQRRIQVSQAGLLVGLDLEAPRRRHRLIPYVLARAQDAGGGIQAGLDGRYAFTPLTSLDLTVRPDFATIEADQETVNLTRFELSLPEKRPFFLEGNELFNQRIRTFYSRRIADIRAGVKFLGRAGPWNLDLISTQSRIGDGRQANYAVARAQREIGRSYVAGMLANRRLAGLNQGSAGVDASLFFSKTLGMTAQVVRSYGRYRHEAWGLLFRPSYDSPTTHVHVRYNDYGARFADNANVVGFITDDDRRELDGNYHRIYWTRHGLLQRLRDQIGGNIYWGHDGNIRGWDVRPRLEADFRGRWSAVASHDEQFRRFEHGFRNRQTDVQVGYNTRQYQSAQAGYSFGRNFDAAFRLWTAEAKRKLTKELAAEYELQRLQLDPDPARRSTWIHVFRASYFFAKDLFVKAFFQTNSAIERKNIQAVFVYRYRPPFGAIQVAYQRGTAPLGQRSDQGDTLFVKITGVF